MSSVEQIEAAIAEIEKEEQSPLPTPPVGTPVVFYPGARIESGAEVAAIVTQVQGPGKLTLAVFRPMGMVQGQKQCLHASHPLHEKLDKAVSRNNGAWDYPQGIRPAKLHYQVHLDELAKRKRSAEAHLEDLKAIKSREESSKAGTKTKQGSAA